jgi:hypothetical protein
MTTDLPVAVGTWVLAVATWALAGVTWWLARRQLSLAKEQLEGQLSIAKEQRQFQLFIELRKQFDDSLIPARKLLATQLLNAVPHDVINETVIDFFEDMGMLIRREFLDGEMVWDTFSYYARMWRNACRDYIAKVRTDHADDTLFTDFDNLAEWICEEEAKRRHKSRAELEPSASDVKRFLQEEAGL